MGNNYYDMEFDVQDHLPDLLESAVARYGQPSKLVPIVSERDGGIIAYAILGNENTIVSALNLQDRKRGNPNV